MTAQTFCRYLVWVCDDPDCLDLATRSGALKQRDFDRLEAEAAIQGGGEAFGRYIDAQGFGHVFEGMPADVFAEAMKEAVAGYRERLKQFVADGAVPF